MKTSRRRAAPAPVISLRFAQGAGAWTTPDELTAAIERLRPRVAGLMADLGIDGTARFELRLVSGAEMLQSAHYDLLVDGEACVVDESAPLDRAAGALAAHIADSLFHNRARFATARLAGTVKAAVSAARVREIIARAFADGLDLGAARRVLATLGNIGWNDTNWIDRVDSLLALHVPKETSVVMGRGLYDAVLTSLRAATGHQSLEAAAELMRDGMFYELGVRFPHLHFDLADDLGPSEFRLLVNRVRGPVMTGLSALELMVSEAPGPLLALKIAGRPVTNPATGAECSIVASADRERCEAAGLHTWDAAGFVILSLSTALRRHAAEFFSAAQAEATLHRVDVAFPMAVFNVLERYAPSEVHGVLRALLREAVSIRDLRGILESMLETQGSLEVDFGKQVVLLARDAHPVLGKLQAGRRVPPADLAECVRVALKRQVSHLQARGAGTLAVYLLDPAIEARLARSDTEPLSRAERAKLLQAVRNEIGGLPVSSGAPVVLTTVPARRRLRALTELAFPRLAVMSFNELTNDLNIQPLARISIA